MSKTIPRLSIAIIATLGVVVVLSCSNSTSTKRVPIDDRDSVVVTVIGEEGHNVLEMLQRGNRVEFESSSMGAFVTAINDVRNSSSIYWMYSINDTMVPLASDKMFVHAGDTIRWRFRKQKG